MGASRQRPLLLSSPARRAVHSPKSFLSLVLTVFLASLINSSSFRVVAETVSVDVLFDSGTRQLVVADGEDVTARVTAFCQENGVSLEVVAQLVGAVEQAYVVRHAKQQEEAASAAAAAAAAEAQLAAQTPLFSLPLVLDGKQQFIEYRRGQDPVAVTGAFLQSLGVHTAPDAASMQTRISQAIVEKVRAIEGEEAVLLQQQQQLEEQRRQQLRLLEQQQQQQEQQRLAAEAAATAALEQQQREAEASKPGVETILPSSPPVYVVVLVDMGDRLMPLEVRVGETPVQAAVRFTETFNLPIQNIDALVKAIERKMEAARQTNQLFSYSVTVDQSEDYLVYRQGEDYREVATAFVVRAGLVEHDYFGEWVSTIANGLQDIHHRYLNLVNELKTNEDLQREQTAAAQAAIEAMGRLETEMVTVSLAVAGSSFDLEFPAGVDSMALASQFCRQEWDVLRTVLKEEGARRGDSSAITPALCSSTVNSILSAQLAKL